MRLSMSEDGTEVVSLVRKTAVPGTLTGFDFSSILIRSSIGIESRCVRARFRATRSTSARTPADQQRHPAAVQDFVQIGDEKSDVYRQECAHERKRAHSGHRHNFQTTKNASAVVVTIVPATAIP
jgi:hypothetical protein